jgi:hypothetical protein
MDNFGKNWQLINILFCGYRRRLEIYLWLEIADPLKMRAKTCILARAQLYPS